MASVRSLKRGFVIKLIFCDHSINIRVNVITVFLGLLCMSGSLYGLKHWYDGQIAAYNARLAELEKSNSQYRSALALKERENQQIAMLAEDRFEAEIRDQAHMGGFLPGNDADRITEIFHHFTISCR